MKKNFQLSSGFCGRLLILQLKTNFNFATQLHEFGFDAQGGARRKTKCIYRGNLVFNFMLKPRCIWEYLKTYSSKHHILKQTHVDLIPWCLSQVFKGLSAVFRVSFYLISSKRTPFNSISLIIPAVWCWEEHTSSRDRLPCWSKLPVDMAMMMCH